MSYWQYREWKDWIDTIGETALLVMVVSFGALVSIACLTGAFEILKFAFTGKGGF